MAKFAETTKTPISYSKAEIEKLVARFGATRFMVATDDDSGTAAVQFFIKDRMIRLSLTLTGAKKGNLNEQENRRRWRSLVMLLKAKLVAVDDGLVEIEKEFLADIVLSNGETVYQRTRGDLALEYKGGSPKLFLGGPN